MIVETPQAGENSQSAEVRLATVAEVLSNGLRLQFDGSDAATQKIYKCNAACMFAEGDRVKVTKCSGTYIVDYVIGGPGSGGGSVSKLENGGVSVELNSSGNLIPSISGYTNLGSSSKLFGSLYVGGANIYLGNGGSVSKLGFFGTTPVAKQTVANNATVSTLIAALKAYGLV